MSHLEITPTDYYVVSPVAGKQAQIADITVTLNPVTLPRSAVNTVYPGFDFKNALMVTGDPTYNAGLVTFNASGLPAGMALSSSGLLTGSPAVENATGTNFKVWASYKNKTSEQAYTLVTTTPRIVYGMAIEHATNDTLTLTAPAGMLFR